MKRPRLWKLLILLVVLFVGITICLALVLPSGLSFLSLGPTSALHVSGNKIYNASGQEVLLRGVGMAGFAPSLIFWGTGESDAWSHQWTSASDSDVSQTFQQLRDVWHVNMIRFFFFPEWWWVDYVTPSVASGAGFSSTPVSTRNFIKTLASEAADYGIYLDIVPYTLTAQTGAYVSDPYLSSSWARPMMGNWDSAQTAFIQSTGYSELEFWSQFWASMANELKSYPNVIFDAWNEPSSRPDYINVIPDGYLTYLTTMYSAIRGTGATNLIMMQWELGWTPHIGMDLSWASQIASAIGTPSNLVYTTHFYYYSPADLSRYWNQDLVWSYDGGVPKTTSQLESDIQGVINTMGVTAPLVINEEGSCRSSSSNVANDYIWWENILQAQANLGVGMCAYYWLSDSGLGGAFSGLGQLSSGYSPNTMGQEYIDVYGSTPSPSATPQPSSTPNGEGSSSGSSPTATPNPDGSTPAPNSEPNQNGGQSEEKPWYQFILDFLNWLGELFS